MTFGERVRELRRARGLTQRDLAKKAGISYAYVSKLETGSMSPPRHKVIQSLAKMLGATDKETDELFGLAGKIPHDLLGKVDAETIRTLRSLGNAPGSGKRLSARSKKRPARSSKPDVQDAHSEEDQRPAAGDIPGAGGEFSGRHCHNGPQAGGALSEPGHCQNAGL